VQSAPNGATPPVPDGATQGLEGPPAKEIAMNKLFIPCFAIVACLSAQAVEVQRTEVAPVTTSAPLAQPALHAVQVLAAYGARTEFEMDNRERLVIEPRLSHLRVRLGSRAPVQVHADGRGHFVSRDGRISLQVSLDPAVEVGGVRLAIHGGA
jgi:hypothetical protein